LTLVYTRLIGGPIKWEKTRIGLDNHFVGYSINIRIFAFGLTELKTQVLTQQPLALDALSAADHGSAQTCPVAARDLMPDLSGAALGAALKQLESDWIASGFSLDRAALLARLNG
ncbi:MAG: hypothetical protein VYA97_05855, partial [Pseudomonadota bacterium]|nr:hypothetical protein [Pseudomonadota bacterium]